jgi:hypothetical protein
MAASVLSLHAAGSSSIEDSGLLALQDYGWINRGFRLGQQLFAL